MADEGCTNRQTADRLNTRTARISKWRQRFAGQRLHGLQDAARSGEPAKYDESTEKLRYYKTRRIDGTNSSKRERVC